MFKKYFFINFIFLSNLTFAQMWDQNEHPICNITYPDATIDIVLLYTQDAAVHPDFGSDLDNNINRIVNEFNYACSSSNVSTRLNLLHYEMVNYTETGDLQQDINNLENTIHPELNVAHNIRDCYGGDLVCLIVSSPASGGIASAIPSIYTGFDESKAFSVITVNATTPGQYTLTHEVGHNLGLLHDRNTINACASSETPAENALCSSMFGYLSPDLDNCIEDGIYFRTIMGKTSQSSNACNYCPYPTPPTRLLYWSNTNVNYMGIPMANEDANAAEVINAAAWAVANYRRRQNNSSFATIFYPDINTIGPISEIVDIQAELGCRYSNAESRNVNIDLYYNNLLYGNIATNYTIFNNTVNYPWDISETVTTGSETAQIRISDSSEPNNIYAESDYFTLLAYDVCESAIPLDVQNSPCNFIENLYLLNSTNSSTTPSCGTPIFSGDVWAKVTIPSSGNIGINVSDGIFDAAFSIHTDCNDIENSEVFCDDVLPLNYEGFNITPGSILYIRTWAQSDISLDSNPIISVCAYEPVVGPPIGPCIPPTNLNTVTETVSSGIVQWNSVPEAFSYNLRYREPPFGFWTTITSFIGGGNNCSNGTCQYNISGLPHSTSYEYQLQTECIGGDMSVWSPSGNFTTSSPNNNISDICSSPTYFDITGGFDDGSGLNNDFPDGVWICPTEIYPQCPDGQSPIEITIMFDVFEMINYNANFGSGIGQRLLIYDAETTPFQLLAEYTEAYGIPTGVPPPMNTPITFNTGKVKLFFESIDGLPGGTNDGWSLTYETLCSCSSPDAPEITTADSTICTEVFDQVLLEASDSNNPNYIHQWQLNGIDIPDANIQTYLAHEIGDYNVYLVDNSNGCESLSSNEISIGGEMCIDLCQGFDISATIQDPTCENNNGEISLVIENGIIPFSFNWNDSINTVNRINLLPDIYTVTVSDGNNCSTIQSFTLTNTQSPPEASFTYSLSEMFVEVMNQSSGEATVLYNYGDGTPETTIPNHLYETPGSYALCLTATNSCGDDIACTTILIEEVPLPIELASFRGETLKDNNLLRWQTATEKNVEKYILERSLDGREWEKIGEVKATGNSSIVRSYSFNDIDPLERGYYRLKVFDNDGSISYSHVLFLERNSDASFTITQIFPNPASQNIFVHYTSANEGEITYSILNMYGEELLMGEKKGTTNQDYLELSLHGMPSGLYVLILQSGGEQTQQKFIKY